MKESLITDINNYISFLNSMGYYVTVKGKRIAGLPEHNVHNNPFCSFVKTNSAAREYRMNCRQKVCKKSGEDIFFGMCHAGIEEYVFFVNSGSFVRYGINKEKAFERIRALSQKYCLNLEELSAICENGLKHEYEDVDKLKIIINPLLHMLSLLPYILNLRIEQSKKLLNTSSLSVTEIALVCGFDNSNCFSTAFKRICGVTPSEYRRKS